MATLESGNLNRMTASPGLSYTNDVLGNRTGLDAAGTANDVAYAWDAVNRMTSLTKGASLSTYRYRADGMRVQKIRSATDHTAYRYDGQMPVEEFNYLPTYPSMTTIKIIRYGPGARGVDLIERTQAGGTVLTGFPVYDGHGNMAATLFRNGSS